MSSSHSWQSAFADAVPDGIAPEAPSTLDATMIAPTRIHDVFLCHVPQDQALAEEICRTLEAQGIRCWLPHRNHPPHLPYDDTVQEALSISHFMVLLFSASASASLQIAQELDWAVRLGLQILPFRIDATVPVPPISELLHHCLWLDALTLPRDPHIQRLVMIARSLLQHDTRVCHD